MNVTTHNIKEIVECGLVMVKAKTERTLQGSGQAESSPIATVARQQITNSAVLLIWKIVLFQN